MYSSSSQILKVSLAIMALFAGGSAVSAQTSNVRSGSMATSGVASVGHSDSRDARRVSNPSVSSTATSRVATRRLTATAGRGNTKTTPATVVSGRSATTTPRAGVVKAATNATHGTTVGRAASSNVVRSAVSNAVARNATKVGASRAASARATALFEDFSVIGGGYAACREAYASCMDQFCGKANDTYRRCFCSSKFEEFRDAEAALDQAKTLLMQFEDNNLNAVDKTAAEVNAMYSATVGEAAIKKDTSAAQSILNEIGDLLSGKKKVSSSNNSTTSLGLISVDFSEGIDDIWSGGVDSIFDTSSGTDLSQLEGQKLFNSANSQCLKLITDSCESDAVLKMSRSAYSIMITQDCNLYEKKINSQRESVKQTVRQAEKILRDARLEEYRAHNSADVNECLDKVKAAITQDLVCGANYKKCLDYSGAYININGEPIYTSRLFELTKQITLDGSSDVLGANRNFNNFLDDKRKFAATALDSCRDQADIVWTEFKRSAIIEIAQAQDAKIEEVKMSCVSTMAECYDTQSKALKNFDKNTAKYADAMAASASRAMCADKVIACAALYGETDGCQVDNSTGKVTVANGKNCGLSALLDFVDTVDNVRVSDGCETALENKLKEDCTSTGSDMGYPWKCREKSKDELEKMILGYAKLYCGVTFAKDATESIDNIAENGIKVVVQKVSDNFKEELDYQLDMECEKKGGYWVADGDNTPDGLKNTLGAFYRDVFGGNLKNSIGKCYQNDAKVMCSDLNIEGETPVARYDSNREECILTDEWYRNRCERSIGGYYDGVDGVCYVKNK